MKSLARVQVEITAIDSEGCGLGKLQGQATVVRVPGVFANETAEIDIIGRSQHHARAFGKLRHLEHPNPARRPIACRQHAHREGACGGCPLMALTEPEQRKQKHAMLIALGLPVDEIHDAGVPSWGYRYSSKRVVHATRQGIQLGSWARGSHRFANMQKCLVDHPKIQRTADEIAQLAKDYRITAYDEKRKVGDLRYVWLKTNGEDVAVTLITAFQDSAACQRLASKITGAWSVFQSVQADAGNAIRGTPPTWICGAKEALPYRVAGVPLEIGPLGFLQPNPRVISAAYRRLTDRPLNDKQCVYDLYAGSGVTTTLLRAQGHQVIPCESYPESARALGVSPMRVEDFLETRPPSEQPSGIIANPPRKGLGARVCALILAREPQWIGIMSCGPQGLRQDLERLQASGAYVVESLDAYDALPQTPHIELVASLRRQTPQNIPKG